MKQYHTQPAARIDLIDMLCGRDEERSRIECRRPLANGLIEWLRVRIEAEGRVCPMRVCQVSGDEEGDAVRFCLEERAELAAERSKAGCDERGEVVSREWEAKSDELWRERGGIG